ncbi:uncharacterized protein LOC110421150 isoform X1 [Herrania umbratica]|uniref:Uncharacterized protein LOC110421150 isoform X1 n=1 Tax=Herrania umbratica TaxID=108875 RepID=A0A6J1AV76_9ROSI|nr:uncharacterized protein LOC110421150 isoform X1 [Herrania umbratica]
MAGAVSLSPTLSFVRKFSLKPLLFSPLSTPVPSKPTKRKNYLRPKILKTITKPFPSSTPTIPITPVESAPENKPVDVVVFEPPSDEIPIKVLEETYRVEEFQVSETSGVAGENSGNFGKISAYSVLKFGFYFVGIFVFQTLVAVWVMGTGNSQDKVNIFQRNKSGNGKFLNNGKVESSSRNMFYWDDSELEEKVKEIRAMAREARKIEEKETKNDDEEGDMTDESLNSKARIGFEKEIGARLNKLEKKLNSKRENFPGSYVNILDKLKDGEDAKDMDKKLFIKKKFKFRAPEKNSRSDVKGFAGLKDGSATRNKNGMATSGSATKEGEDGKRVVSQNLDFLPSDGEDIEKIEEEELGAVHNNMREIYNKPPANKVKDNQSSIKTDPWWLNLPYVLAVLMRRGVDHEGPGGLFTLRISSEGQEQSETSCTVAFEDHSDANNFCYLLECFFEDLGDFSAEVVPMSVKELYQAIKSHAKKVIVVRKGQLKLYAGQPFAEVEMALHSLIKDNQSASIATIE